MLMSVFMTVATVGSEVGTIIGRVMGLGQEDTRGFEGFQERRSGGVDKELPAPCSRVWLK